MIALPRLSMLAALLASLVVAVPSAAVNGSGKIAFATNSGVFSVNADGSQLSQISVGAETLSWSPDGSKLAIVRYDTAGKRLYVVNADGSNERLVAESSNFVTGPFFISDQPWSPDGAWIAFADGSGIHRASSAGGDVRTVTTEMPYSPPVWSPTGSLLAYSSTGNENKLVVIAPDGTGRTEIVGGPAFNIWPTWSPAGDAIAFKRILANDGTAIWVVHPDGSERHKVVVTDGSPAWSPDGTRIAFTTSLGYNGRSPISDVFSVAADGSTLRRLTNTLGGRSPTWSPDGDRVLFERGSQLETINADGSCEDVLEPFVQTWSWQPLSGGPHVGERRCAAVSVRGEALGGGGGFSIAVTISNQGTEPLSRIRLVAFAPNGLSLSPVSTGCPTPRGRVICLVSGLDRGEIRQLTIRVHPRRFSRDPRIPVLEAQLRVTAEEQLLRTGREADAVAIRPTSCRTRDPGEGRVDGSRFSDSICGRRGPDRIYPGAGKDVVTAGGGSDVVFAKDGERDRISCGPGRDLVIADAKDRVARDCERVIRR